MFRALALSLLSAALAVPSARADSKQDDRQALQGAIEEVVGRAPLAGARLGIQVVSLESGEVIYAKNPDDLLNPASNVKLFTGAAALARLGPGFRFSTEYLLDKQPEPNPKKGAPKPGEYKGNFYVRGRADPSLTTEKLWGLVRELSLSGLKSVSGDLVLDDSYFDEETVGPGFDQERSDRTYMAPPGALSLNSNAVGIYITPGAAVGGKARVVVDPASDFFVIDNRVTTGRANSYRRLTVSSVPMGDKQKILVTGRIPLGHPVSSVWKKIDSPTMYFGYTLKALLAERGIKIGGKVRRGSVPPEAERYDLEESDSLDLVLKRLNKNSSNFMAEMLVKTLGAELKGAPGSWGKGIDAIEDFLSGQLGLARGTFVMKNGSGLNDTNRFSAAQICRVLRSMWRDFPLAPEYLSSLGIAGFDGTLHYRMIGTHAVGRLRAKTGTLENVSSLSGYVEAVGGERFVFAVVANDFSGRIGPVVSALDAVGSAIAGFGRPGGPAQGIAQAMGQAPLAGPLAELKARIAIYQGMGKQRDPRNLVFLRTSVKAERDPAVKVMVAEALFRSNPEDSGAARAVIDLFDAGPDVFGRLRQLAREAGTPTPLVRALAAIGAEGNSDALGKLLEIAAVAKDDEPLRRELLEPLSEVTRSAPEEVIGALQAAPAQTQAAALDLIAQALGDAGEADHPFPEAVRRSMGSADPLMAGFAKGLEEQLSVRLAAQKAPALVPVEPAAATPRSEETRTSEVRPGG